MCVLIKDMEMIILTAAKLETQARYGEESRKGSEPEAH